MSRAAAVVRTEKEHAYDSTAVDERLTETRPLMGQHSVNVIAPAYSERQFWQNGAAHARDLADIDGNQRVATSEVQPDNKSPTRVSDVKPLRSTAVSEVQPARKWSPT